MDERKQANKEIDEVLALSERAGQRLKSAFQKVIDSPTEKKVKRYEDYETALLALYSRELYKLLSAQVGQYTDIGKTQAVQQLLDKGFKKRKLQTKVYNELKQAQRQAIKESVLKLIAGIKQNSRNNVLDMRDAMILQKKRLAGDFIGTFNKYGIAYFKDSRGARWSLKRYMDMLTTQTMMNTQRQAFFATSLEYGNDLVKIMHLGISPECELCRPFAGKVLSITGKTRGYMSVEQASMSGHLFGYNCDHYVSALELAPEKEKDDNKIELNDKNIQYLKKNGIKKVKQKAWYQPS